MTDTAIDRARALLILRETQPILFSDSMNMCDQLADVLAEMVDEVERLTKRLRELCEQEPVALGLDAVIDGQGWVLQLPVRYTKAAADLYRRTYETSTILRAVELIRRPEMPS